MNDMFIIPVRKYEAYPTLYARTSTGAVQVWYMEQEDNKYRSIYGQIDGVHTVSEWTVAKGKNVGRKNGTSAVDQATKEIEAKYDKQINNNGYWEDIEDIDRTTFFEVMLAKSYSDYKEKIDWSEGVGVQIKYNGGRIIASKDGLFSRRGKRYKCLPHIEEALKPFFLKFPDAVLDGEGFNYPLRERLNEIMKLLRKTVHFTKEDLQKSKELIRFYVYDGFGFTSEKDGPIISSQDGYLKRKKAIDYTFFSPEFRKTYENIIDEVPTWIVNSEKELETLYGLFLNDKQEGAILRILNQRYENKRSKYLLKYKPVDDAEYKVISVNEGIGGWANRVATFTCQRIDGGKYTDGTDTFNATFKGDEDDAFEAWRVKDDIINEIVTIQYNGTTGFGKPNYARLDWNNYLHDK
jgi:DNA ligase 1